MLKLTLTTVGTLLLAFLLYALWRKRKGATYAEIVQFRHSSGTVTMSPGPRNTDFTALPIYRESRFSVRSTKRGSMLSINRLLRRPAPSPSSESFGKAAWLRNKPLPAEPSTPTRAGHPLSQVTFAPLPSARPPKAPEMSHTPHSSQSERIRIDRTLSSEAVDTKPEPII